MGQGDYMPVGGHKRKANPKHAKAIKEGGKKADAIRKKARAHHHQVEVPLAEEELERALEELEANDAPNPS